MRGGPLRASYAARRRCLLAAASRRGLKPAACLAFEPCIHLLPCTDSPGKVCKRERKQHQWSALANTLAAGASPLAPLAAIALHTLCTPTKARQAVHTGCPGAPASNLCKGPRASGAVKRRERPNKLAAG